MSDGDNINRKLLTKYHKHTCVSYLYSTGTLMRESQFSVVNPTLGGGEGAVNRRRRKSRVKQTEEYKDQRAGKGAHCKTKSETESRVENKWMDGWMEKCECFRP